MMRAHRFNSERVSCIPGDDGYLKMWFEAHRAINLTSISCVLSDMEKLGLPKAQAEALKASAKATLALISTEINRLHGF